MRSTARRAEGIRTWKRRSIRSTLTRSGTKRPAHVTTVRLIQARLLGSIEEGGSGASGESRGDVRRRVGNDWGLSRGAVRINGTSSGRSATGIGKIRSRSLDGTDWIRGRLVEEVGRLLEIGADLPEEIMDLDERAPIIENRHNVVVVLVDV